MTRSQCRANRKSRTKKDSRKILDYANPFDTAKADHFPRRDAQKCLQGRLSRRSKIKCINVTSFSSISYWSNSEYWTQKRIQSESIYSTILDVHVWKAERQICPFLSVQLKLDKDLTLSPQFLLKLLYFQLSLEYNKILNN